ncbi:MAG: hypothetical protein NVSMB31_06270 [Vulcanimicrobiaceae bacterium]
MSIDRDLLERSVSVKGRSGAPPLVLVHGVHLGRYSWTPHVELLAKSFRVATIDLPRHGTLYDVAFTQEHLTQQLRYVIDEVLKEPPLLVGYSLGGYVITQFSQAFPASTTGLILAGCSLDPTAWRANVYGALLQTTQLVPRPIFDLTSQLFFRLTLERQLAQAIISNPFNPAVFREAHHLLGNQHFSRMLGNYLGKVLIVNGQFDVVFRPQASRYARASAAQTRIVRGGDHVFPLRRPAEFCEIISDFYDQLISAQPTG